MNANEIDELFRDAEKSTPYKAESLALDVVAGIWAQMKAAGLSQAELAEKLGKKAAFVSRVLSGPHNLTLRTIAEFAAGLDCDVRVEFEGNSPRDLQSAEAVTNVSPQRYRRSSLLSACANEHMFVAADLSESDHSIAA